MPGVHAAGETVHIGVPATLGVVEAAAAGEHQVGHPEERILSLHQLARRVFERGELVHAVVHDAAGSQSRGKRHGHRCVEPNPVISYVLLTHRVRDHALQYRQMIVVEAGDVARDMRTPHLDTRYRLETLEMRLRGP